MTPDGHGALHSTARGKPAWETSEEYLNFFLRSVAVLERWGNSFGSWSFTWANTVVVNNSSELDNQDFWYAAMIIFIGNFRYISRENKSDDELLFKTTGGIKLKRVNMMKFAHYLIVAVIMVPLYGVFEGCLFRFRIFYGHGYFNRDLNFLLRVLILVLLSIIWLPKIVQQMNKYILGRFAPSILVLAFGGLQASIAPDNLEVTAIWVSMLLVACLIIQCTENNICQFQFQSRFVAALPLCLCRLCSFIFKHKGWANFIAFGLIACVTQYLIGSIGLLMLFGVVLVDNIQVPLAIARIALSSMHLQRMHYNHETDNPHLVGMLKTLYLIVIVQGALYTAACILESLLSRILRVSLARKCGLGYKKGLQCVDMFYEDAYMYFRQDGILSREDLTLVNYAFESLHSKSRERKLAGVRIIYSILQLDGPNQELVSKIITSTDMVTILIRMLGLTAPQDNAMRLLAAKVIAQLAGDIQIVEIHGTMQMISCLLYAEDTAAQRVDSIVAEENTPVHSVNISGESVVDQLSSRICKIMQYYMSVPEGNDEPLDEDCFPLLGMLILEKLAHSFENCAEISGTIELIPKIIHLMGYATDITNMSDAQHKLLITSSLKLVAKLVSTEGEVGMELRRKISDQPFLMSNFVEILEDTDTTQRKLVMGILAKVALSEEMREEIGSFQVFIPKLISAFLDVDCSMRMEACATLSILSMNNANNCAAMWKERGCDLFEELMYMLQHDDYLYVASIALQNLCSNSIPSVQHYVLLSMYHLCSHSKLSVVLTKMMNAKGQQLEALIGLTSQICYFIPNIFVETLQQSHITARSVVQKLVGALNTNKKPSPEYPRMRRVVVELAITLMKSCSNYAVIFKEEGMMQVLSKVEERPSRVKNYRVFSGSAGVILENGLSLRELVASAKGLLEPQQGHPSGLVQSEPEISEHQE
uniref:Uncharacterized protein n=1 Tax=Arundo donax TaxID=35708 RepID=A0A0A8XST5_ARUDO